MKQTLEERNEKQRKRQQTVRDRHKADRKPTRDDVARVALQMMIERTFAKYPGDKPRARRKLDVLQEAIVAVLVEQKFSKMASDRFFEDLVEKYEAGWEFRRKVHLLDPPPSDGDEDL